MGRIGHGYGSEWHLLRYLGRHRNLLDRTIRETTGCGSLEWLDLGIEPNNPRDGAEWKGLNFLAEDTAFQDSWQRYWPQGAGIHYWDAVARDCSGRKTEWVLVEAKVNLEEMRSGCQDRNKESLRKINAAFAA